MKPKTALLVGLGVVATLVAIQSPVVFGGRTLLPLASGSSTAPGTPYGYNGPVPDWTATNDPMGGLNFSYADDTFNAWQFGQGRFPLWNPYQGLGAPYLADNLSALLYPVNWLGVVLSPSLFDVIYFVDWALAAFFLALLLMEWGLSRSLALMATIPLLVCGQRQINLPLRELGASATWFPLLVYGIERGLRDSAWRWRQPVLGVATFCTIAGGQQQVAFLSILTATVYALARIVHGRLPFWKSMAKLLPGVGGGLLLAAPVWLTFADYIPGAQTTHSARLDGPWHLRVESLSTFFYPYLYGRVQQYPLGRIEGWTWNRSPGWSQAACLFGVFASLPMLWRKRSWGLAVLWVLAVVWGGKVWGLPGINALGSLPVLNLIKFPCYAVFLFDFAVAGLAAYGLSYLVQPDAKWGGVLAAWYIAAGLLLVLGLHAWTNAWANVEIRSFAILGAAWAVAAPLAMWLVHRRTRGEPLPFFTTAAAGILLQGISSISYGYSRQSYVRFGEVALGAFVGIAVLCAVPRLRSATAWALLPMVAAFGLVASATAPEGLPRRFNIFTHLPHVELLRAKEEGGRYRYVGADGVLEANFAGRFGLTSVNLFDGILPRPLAEFQHRFLDPAGSALFFGVGFRGEGFAKSFSEKRRFFNLIGAKYFVGTGTDPNLAAPKGSKLPLIYSDASRGIRIWENRDAFPRAFLVHRTVGATSWEEAFTVLPTIDDLRGTAVVESAPPMEPSSPMAGAEEGVSALTLSPNDLSVQVRTSSPSLLVLTDTFAAGWTATLDGQEAPVLRVDGVFRGVRLPIAGEHRVQMRYRPPHWLLILALAALGAVLLGAGWVRN